MKLAAFVFFALPCLAQTDPAPTPASFLASFVETSQVPRNLTTFGLGFNGEGTNYAGTSAYYHLITGTTYTGVKTNLSGSTSSNTVEVKQVILAKSGLMVLVNGNAGIATGANGGTGLANMEGAQALYNVSRLKFLRDHPGIWLGAEWQSDARNVSQFAAQFKAAPNAALLRDFARQSRWGLMFGYAWN